MKASIRSKILKLNLSGLLFCTLLIGGVGILGFSNYIQKDVEDSLRRTSEKETERISNTLEKIEQYVRTLNYVVLENIDSAGTLKNDSALEAITHQNLNIIRSTIKNIPDAISIYMRYNPKLTPPTSGIFLAKTTSYGNIQKLTPTDFSKYSPDDVEHVGWYYIPIQNRSPLWLDPYENKNINVYMISYVEPLIKNGDEIGVIGMDIDFHYLTSKISEIKLFETGYAYLESTNGTVIYHPSLKMGEKFNKSRDILHVQNLLPNGMKLVLVVPKSEIYADRNFLIWNIAGFALFIFLIFAFVSIYFAKSITRPLMELTEAANQMTEGNLDVSFDVAKDGEIGTLCKSFASACEYIREYLGYVKGIAYKDSLTGVRNKTAYDNFILDFKTKIQQNHITRFGIILLDVNRLKFVNDTYGHDHGNMLLINACRLICQVFAHSPVFRIGGDEFVVVLQHKDYDDRKLLMSIFQEEMRKAQATATTDWGKVSIAAGLAIYNGSDSVEDVVKQADEAMYQNKKEMKGGRD